MSTRLEQQLAFIREIDKTKTILRRTYLLDGSRPENDAEHSWHLATMALVLAEYAAEPVDITRVVKMLLLHDIVEIDAGDTFVYDTSGYADKAERELQAANRIFGLLPPDLEKEFRALWEEFESRETPESKFAQALDRVQPIMHNYYLQGGGWKKHGISARQIRELNCRIADGAPQLWDYVQQLINNAVKQGFIAEE